MDIRPARSEPDVRARGEGWVRSDVERGFRLEHREYDRRRMDGFGYDIGAALIVSADAPDESELDTVLNARGFRPDLFVHPKRRSQVGEGPLRGAVSSPGRAAPRRLRAVGGLRRHGSRSRPAEGRDRLSSTRRPVLPDLRVHRIPRAGVLRRPLERKECRRLPVACWGCVSRGRGRARGSS
ncbi:hypothetical protein GCM10010448_42270 [Streptomyces glomeratus]|uniref:Uncharacterized protein n=1 Tax=Streptomyces glomeratus TaxID=284452 RepID=A0ABP6LQ28_9ACTN